MASSPPPLWSLPKPQRPPHGSWLTAILFFISFNAGIVLTNLLQLISLPLALFPTTYPTFLRILDFTKGTFGQLTIFISQRFAPTSFVVTAGHGMPDGDSWLERDGRGRVTGIKLPPTGIWMSNHQTLSDWLYIWSFAYFSSHHAAMLITLKASLKWIPFVGWACQLYGFVFLARRWASDKGPFKAQLEKVSERCRAGRGDGKLALLIFPEGTLVTGNTRPISAKFAAKLGGTSQSPFSTTTY
jgi:lysocardiolipin and lysophospholipid acyltransferase